MRTMPTYECTVRAEAVVRVYSSSPSRAGMDAEEVFLEKLENGEIEPEVYCVEV